MFSERLQQARKDAGLTQSDIAREIDLTTSAYGYYEQGKRDPNFETLMRLCSILNVSSDYLLGLDNLNENKESYSSSASLKTKENLNSINHEIKKAIAQNIMLYRKKKKLTQRELAILLNTKTTLVSAWERGTSTPDVENLFNICKILEVSIIDMIGHDAVESTTISISRIEKAIVLAYRNADEIDKTIVHRTLNISPAEAFTEQYAEKAVGK